MKIDWSGIETFTPSGAAVRLTDDLSIEWTPDGAVAAQAEILHHRGHEVIRITTSPGNGWVRMHLKVDPEDKPALGARFILSASGPGTEVALKPFIAVTNLQTGKRRDIATAPGARMTLLRGQWYDLSGAFLCKPMGKNYRADIIVDLPRNARILFAAASYDWFAGELDPAAQDEVKKKEALPLSPFGLRPVSDIATYPALPPVYAMSIGLSRDRLTGWALTTAESLHWSEVLSGRSGAVRRSGAARVGGVLSAEAGFEVAFTPPLRTESAGAPDIDGKPVSDFLHIRKCRTENHEILVEGDAVHPLYKGMPLRLGPAFAALNFRPTERHHGPIPPPLGRVPFETGPQPRISGRMLLANSLILFGGEYRTRYHFSKPLEGLNNRVRG